MIVVFIGPTLPTAEVRAALAGTEAQLLPPAAQGDLYRAARRRPRAIGLVDGFFGNAPAVWHKEVLWALQQGIPVWGASSMGALRAAELEAFGMVGVGAIFEAYRDGRLTDDDEVALCHAPAELGYVPLSEPLVNIRATLAAARAAGAVSDAQHDSALAVAQALHYPQRSWAAIRAGLQARGETPCALDDWLAAGGRVDQKALDARALLGALRGPVELPARVRDWPFEHTAMWNELVRVHAGGSGSAHATSAAERRLHALAGDTPAGHTARLAALARLLAGDLARREGKPVHEDELLQALAALRQAHRLHEPADLQTWLHANDLDTAQLVELLASEVRLRWVLDSVAQDLEPHLLDHLKLSGAYATAAPEPSAARPAPPA